MMFFLISDTLGFALIRVLVYILFKQQPDIAEEDQKQSIRGLANVALIACLLVLLWRITS